MLLSRVMRRRGPALLLALALWSGGNQSADAQTRIHVVERGDTLWELARDNGCTVEQLQRANKLRSPDIWVGMKLHLPCSGKPKAKEPPIRVVRGQSVGRPHKGKLKNGVQLPHDPGYYRRRTNSAWGAQHVVDYTRAAVAAVRKKHPKVHRLAVGDLSSKKGGWIAGHASHQSGRDIDLGLYFKARPAGYPKEFVAASKGRLHVAATWTLVYSLYKSSSKPGGARKIFLDYSIQKSLYKHARAQGVSRATLKKVLQYPDGRWAKKRLVQHVHNHHDHLHVRFGCPPKDKSCG